MSVLPKGKIVTIDDKEFNFSIATTGVELMSGLRGVTSLEPYDGMLFDFGCYYPIHMTPKGLLYPVDLAFLGEDGTIFEITKLDPDNGFTKASKQRAWYALEVPLGFFQEHRIEVGTRINL